MERPKDSNQHDHRAKDSRQSLHCSPKVQALVGRQNFSIASKRQASWDYAKTDG